MLTLETYRVYIQNREAAKGEKRTQFVDERRAAC